MAAIPALLKLFRDEPVCFFVQNYELADSVFGSKESPAGIVVSKPDPWPIDKRDFDNQRLKFFWYPPDDSLSCCCHQLRQLFRCQRIKVV
jgi:hypothetical protein